MMAPQIDPADAGIIPPEGESHFPLSGEVAAELPLLPRVGWWRIASWSAILLGISAVAGGVAGLFEVHLHGPLETGQLSRVALLFGAFLMLPPSLVAVVIWVRRQGLTLVGLWGIRLDSQARIQAVLGGATLCMAYQVLLRSVSGLLPLRLEFTHVEWGIVAADLFLRGAAIPVVEELFFRALLVAALKGRGFGDGAVIGFTSLIFAAHHIDSYLIPPNLVWFAVLGAVLAFVRLRTRSLEACILVHQAHNAASILLAAAA